MDNLFALYPPAPPTAEERQLEQQQKAAAAVKLVRRQFRDRSSLCCEMGPTQLLSYGCHEQYVTMCPLCV